MDRSRTARRKDGESRYRRQVRRKRDQELEAAREIRVAMSQRLVKTIQATQVRSIGQPSSEESLSAAELELLVAVSRRFDETIQLRRAGLSPREISYLEFARWSYRTNR